VLDIMLPGRSGLDVLRELRAAGATLPVLMLTAKGDVVDRVVGLELGADDCPSRSRTELLARVRALLRAARAAVFEARRCDAFDFRARWPPRV
jgi:DNA-binding response OmpR family regulator